MCTWRVPPAAVSVLTWGAPFEEAWLRPFIERQCDGRPVSYSGTSVGRGDPAADEYLRLAVHDRRRRNLRDCPVPRRPVTAGSRRWRLRPCLAIPLRSVGP